MGPGWGQVYAREDTGDDLGPAQPVYTGWPAFASHDLAGPRLGEVIELNDSTPGLVDTVRVAHDTCDATARLLPLT